MSAQANTMLEKLQADLKKAENEGGAVNATSSVFSPMELMPNCVQKNKRTIRLGRAGNTYSYGAKEHLTEVGRRWMD